MSEETEAGGAPAEAVEVAAPVESAPVEAAPTDTDEASSTVEAEETTEAAETSLPAETDSEESAPVSYPSSDDFGWDEWAGDLETLPEQVRPWGVHLDKYYQARMEGMSSDIDQTREIYEALIGGKEDPRVAKFQSSISDWEQKHLDISGRYEALEKEYIEYQQVVQEAIDAESKEYAEEFAAKNPELFNNDELATSFADLLEEGWILEHAAEAARLPKAVLDVARQAKKDGVPDAYAIRLAKGAKSKPATPRPGAALTSGATTPARASEQAELAQDKPMSLKEYRTQVARNALNRRR